MNIRTNAQVILSALTMLSLSLVGCDRDRPPAAQPAQASQPQIIDRVRKEAAKILKKDAAQVDVSKPLAALGADELDTVEIVMAVEEAFNVEIPDDVIAGKSDEVSKTLTLQKLAELVSRQKQKK